MESQDKSNKNKLGKESNWNETIRNIVTLIGFIITSYTGLVVAGVVDFPWAKSKIEFQLRTSMTDLQTGLEELDEALDLEGKDIADGIVKCSKTHPANVLHGYQFILNAKSYDISGEPRYIKKAYADYQKAIQTVNSESLQQLYSACLIFDRTGSGDPELTQEQFDTISLNSQAAVTESRSILISAIEKMP